MKGLGDFIYGGDPNWVRRRYWLFLSSMLAWAGMVGACVGSALGGLSVDLAQTVVTSGFAFHTILTPGYLFSATWDTKIKADAGATVSETTTTTVDPGPPAKTTETTKTEVKPATPLVDPTAPPAGFAEG